MSTFGERLKEARKRAGISQVELSRSVDLSKSTICNYEAGKRERPSIPIVKAIAEVLNVPWWELAGLPVEEIDGQKHVRRLDYEENALANYEKFHGQEAQRREALLSHYDRLNDDGQQKAVERVQELAEVPRYRKNGG